MIRGPSVANPFANSPCPYGDEDTCQRPHCPFAHSNSTQSPENNNKKTKKKQRLDDDDDEVMEGNANEEKDEDKIAAIGRGEEEEQAADGGYVGYFAMDANIPPTTTSPSASTQGLGGGNSNGLQQQNLPSSSHQQGGQEGGGGYIAKIMPKKLPGIAAGINLKNILDKLPKTMPPRPKAALPTPTSSSAGTTTSNKKPQQPKQRILLAKKKPPVWRRPESFASKLFNDFETAILDGASHKAGGETLMDKLFGSDDDEDEEKEEEGRKVRGREQLSSSTMARHMEAVSSSSTNGKKKSAKLPSSISSSLISSKSKSSEKIVFKDKVREHLKNNEAEKKKEEAEKKRPLWEIDAKKNTIGAAAGGPGTKRRRSSTESLEKKKLKKKHRSRSGEEEGHEDEATRRERQELIDQISDDEITILGETMLNTSNKQRCSLFGAVGDGEVMVLPSSSTNPSVLKERRTKSSSSSNGIGKDRHREEEEKEKRKKQKHQQRRREEEEEDVHVDVEEWDAETEKIEAERKKLMKLLKQQEEKVAALKAPIATEGKGNNNNGTSRSPSICSISVVSKKAAAALLSSPARSVASSISVVPETPPSKQGSPLRAIIQMATTTSSAGSRQRSATPPTPKTITKIVPNVDDDDGKKSKKNDEEEKRKPEEKKPEEKKPEEKKLEERKPEEKKPEEEEEEEEVWYEKGKNHGRRIGIAGINFNKRPKTMLSAKEQMHKRAMQTILQAGKEQRSSTIGSGLSGGSSAATKTSSTPPPPTTSSSTVRSQTQKSPKMNLMMLAPKFSSIRPLLASSSSNSSAFAASTSQKRQHHGLASPAAATTKTPQIVGSLKKGEQRKAHQPQMLTSTIGKSSRPLVPLEPNNKKVSLQVRQSRLTLLYGEYKKFCGDEDLAVNSAQLEEKDILEKCHSQNGYCAAIPGAIRRIRDFVASGGGQQGSSKDKISHHTVLLGKHADSVTLGLHRAQRHTATSFSELDFYNALMADYVLNEEQLWLNGYPRWVKTAAAEQEMEHDGFDDLFENTNAINTNNKKEEQKRNRVEIRPSELDATKGRARQQFVPDSEFRRVCARCGVEYRLTKEGQYAPGVSSEECIYHWGRAWKKRVSGSVDVRYTCCQSGPSERGCVVAGRHITQSLRLSTLDKYVATPNPLGVGDPRSRKVYALDCEMVYCLWGPEVARISVVDIMGELVLDVLVRPEHMLIDCNTRFSGLTSDQVYNAECNNLDKARLRLFELVNSETILIGHSLESDLRSMRIVHPRVVDTSIVFPHRLGPPQKRALKTLATEILQLIIQEEVDGHNSQEDALTCMRIMLRKVRGSADAIGAIVRH